MLEREKMERGIYEIVDTGSLVSAEHLLRKIDAAVDWNKLYDMVEPLCCADNGRPSVDPVVLFKMVLIQHLYQLKGNISDFTELSIIPFLLRREQLIECVRGKREVALSACHRLTPPS